MTTPVQEQPLRTVIRDQFRADLKQAGNICVVAPAIASDHDIKHVRVAAVQAARLEKIQVKLRTIDGRLHARRLDMAGTGGSAVTTMTMPGSAVTNVPTTEDYLIALSPWPDDDQYDAKTQAITEAIAALSATADLLEQESK